LLQDVVSWLALQISKQKRTDFKPRNDDSVFARVNTEACATCCDGLDKVRDAAEQNLSGKNLEVFLTEIGISFHASVLRVHSSCVVLSFPQLAARSHAEVPGKRYRRVDVGQVSLHLIS
jgi:hypothetical protein